jgi:hypothetical protein
MSGMESRVICHLLMWRCSCGPTEGCAIRAEAEQDVWRRRTPATSHAVRAQSCRCLLWSQHLQAIVQVLRSVKLNDGNRALLSYMELRVTCHPLMWRCVYMRWAYAVGCLC